MRAPWLKEGIAARWLAAAALLISLAMVVGLLAVVSAVAGKAFWPRPLVLLRLADGRVLLGEVWTREADPNHPGHERWRLKTGNRDLEGQDFVWVPKAAVVAREVPAGAWLVERREYGNFYGFASELHTPEGIVSATDERFGDALAKALQRGRELVEEERHLLDRLAALHAPVVKYGARAEGAKSERRRQRALAALERARGHEEENAPPLLARLAEVRHQAEEVTLVMTAAGGQEMTVPAAGVVRAVPVNALGLGARVGLYLSRWWEFLFAEPREANTEGGIFPALFGTALMVFLMTFAVVPLGVITAVYLNEYASGGMFTRAVRLALANLAGVPSIVFGVFGLAFFVYGVGGTIDRLLFADSLPTPTFGTGGILWASLTLALLTVPVVVVATEEGLQSVPDATRDGARALGATRWQTLRHVVLPYAAPGVLTGTILAVARAAGEVAPLMLTGVVKLAPALPLDGVPPYLHLERKFMHLGFHIYDVGFQSPNVEAAKPMVYATTLVLLALVVVLNLLAIALRARLRRRLSRSAV
ncbi:MAG: phosphate ABC transporter permease PstA [Acidobacteriota bacterium]